VKSAATLAAIGAEQSYYPFSRVGFAAWNTLCASEPIIAPDSSTHSYPSELQSHIYKLVIRVVQMLYTKYITAPTSGSLTPIAVPPTGGMQLYHPSTGSWVTTPLRPHLQPMQPSPVDPSIIEAFFRAGGASGVWIHSSKLEPFVNRAQKGRAIHRSLQPLVMDGLLEKRLPFESEKKSFQEATATTAEKAAAASAAKSRWVMKNVFKKDPYRRRRYVPTRDLTSYYRLLARPFAERIQKRVSVVLEQLRSEYVTTPPVPPTGAGEPYYQCIVAPCSLYERHLNIHEVFASTFFKSGTWQCWGECSLPAHSLAEFTDTPVVKPAAKPSVEVKRMFEGIQSLIDLASAFLADNDPAHMPHVMGKSALTTSESKVPIVTHHKPRRQQIPRTNAEKAADKYFETYVQLVRERTLDWVLRHPPLFPGFTEHGQPHAEYVKLQEERSGRQIKPHQYAITDWETIEETALPTATTAATATAAAPAAAAAAAAAVAPPAVKFPRQYRSDVFTRLVYWHLLLPQFEMINPEYTYPGFFTLKHYAYPARLKYEGIHSVMAEKAAVAAKAAKTAAAAPPPASTDEADAAFAKVIGIMEPSNLATAAAMASSSSSAAAAAAVQFDAVTHAQTDEDWKYIFRTASLNKAAQAVQVLVTISSVMFNGGDSFDVADARFDALNSLPPVDTHAPGQCDNEPVMVYCRGVPMRLDNLTQTDLDEMTDDEFKSYEDIVGQLGYEPEVADT